MSVLLKDRNDSTIEYVYTARQIYIETLNFITKLSARYSRTIGNDLNELSSAMFNHVVMGNDIFPSDEIRFRLREEYLLQARGELSALDAKLSICYDLMMMNPAGCFTTSSGKSVDSSKAIKKIDNMAQNLGELIDKERRLITSVLKRDKEKRKQNVDSAEN